MMLQRNRWYFVAQTNEINTFFQMFHFYSPENVKITFGVQLFSGGTKRSIGKKWNKLNLKDTCVTHLVLLTKNGWKITSSWYSSILSCTLISNTNFLDTGVVVVFTAQEELEFRFYVGFKSCSQRIRGLPWWKPFPMISAGNKLSTFLLINY